ncbi:MAG: hypothetical protein SPJ92_03895 [Bariatricus sp.]|nr:hypothetical protein [Bariatricus sp.]
MLEAMQLSQILNKNLKTLENPVFSRVFPIPGHFIYCNKRPSAFLTMDQRRMESVRSNKSIKNFKKKL